MIPFLVIAHYVPSKWNAQKVGKELTEATRRLGLIPHDDPAHGPLHSAAWFSDELHAEVRRRTFKTKQAEDWHYDGDLGGGANPNCALVLWSTNHPTEIMYNNKIYVPNPYDLVIFKNMSVRHRRPPGCPRIRWTFRQRTQVPEHLNLL